MTDKGQVFYKGFDKNMQCRGFQYVEGETYEQAESPAVCKNGFHACGLPLATFSFYPPCDGNQYGQVYLEDVTEESADSKVAARVITVGASVNVFGLVKAHVEAIWNRATDQKKASPDAQATTGDWANAATTGNCFVSAEATGSNAVAAVLGRGKAKAALGCWLVLTERDDDLNILGVQAVQVDGETIKPGVYYTLKGGEIVEAE